MRVGIPFSMEIYQILLKIFDCPLLSYDTLVTCLPYAAGIMCRNWLANYVIKCG